MMSVERGNQIFSYFIHIISLHIYLKSEPVYREQKHECVSACTTIHQNKLFSHLDWIFSPSPFSYMYKNWWEKEKGENMAYGSRNNNQRAHHHHLFIEISYNFD